jgi:glycerophosphoryl diester phosphodiesterase
MWQEIKDRMGATWRELGLGKQPVFITHVIYSALGVIALFPVTGLIGRLFLSLSGESALADQDILLFAMTPLGLAAVVVLSAMMVFVIAFEQASLMAIGISIQQGRAITVLSALNFGVTKAPQIFEFALRLVLRLLLLILPFLAAAAAVGLHFLTEFDINFYLSSKPAEFWLAAILISLILIAMLALVVRKSVQWSIALPLVLFADEQPSRCFQQSALLLRGKQRPLMIILITWAGASFVIGSVALGVLHLFGSALIPLVAHSLRWLVLVLGGLFSIWLLANLLLSGLTAGIVAFVLSDVFQRVRPGNYAVVEKDEAELPHISDSRKLTIRGLAGLLIAAVSVAGGFGIWLLDGIQVNDEAIVIAHRGASGRAPENTLEAVEFAIEDGADWVEIDVQETSDGEIVVVHDRDFMKLAGENLSVANGSLQQVRAVDVGAWYGSDFVGARVPTLAEVLNAAKGKSGVIIELKYYGLDVQLEQRVVDIVEQVGMSDSVMIMSLSLDGIRKMQALRPEWTYGLLVAQSAGNLATIDVDFLAVSSRIATTQLMRRAVKAGKPVYVWTVNDPVSISRMLSLGVDGIITDEPALAREVLLDRSEMNSVERLLVHTAILMGRDIPTPRYRDESP